jgi:hypothetical protein
MKQIAEELGVGIVVEGSVDKGRSRAHRGETQTTRPAKASLTAIVERSGVIGSNPQRLAAVRQYLFYKTGDFAQRHRRPRLGDLNSYIFSLATKIAQILRRT